MGFLGDVGDVFGAIGTGVGDLFSGGAISKTQGAREANRAQQKALLEAGRINEEQYNKNIGIIDQHYQEAINSQNLYEQSGADALPGLQDTINQMGQRPEAYNDTSVQPESYTPGQFKFTLTPEMQQKIDASRNAVETSASARGLLGSSGALKSIQQNTADIAQQGVNDQFNQFQNTEAMKQSSANNNIGQFNTNRNFNYGKYNDQIRNDMDALKSKYAGQSGLVSMGQHAADNISTIEQNLSGAQTGANDNYSSNAIDIATGKANSTSAKANAEGEARGNAPGAGLKVITDTYNAFKPGAKSK